MTAVTLHRDYEDMDTVHSSDSTLADGTLAIDSEGWYRWRDGRRDDATGTASQGTAVARCGRRTYGPMILAATPRDITRKTTCQACQRVNAGRCVDCDDSGHWDDGTACPTCVR